MSLSSSLLLQFCTLASFFCSSGSTNVSKGGRMILAGSRSRSVRVQKVILSLVTLSISPL
ncbi:hypothetical protein AN958_06923 [Leucoagaricus sp. SymC.cos]|nr:hypothetical protein AN958_06923 [Leucoagaricus sp. SymC.cos]